MVLNGFGLRYMVFLTTRFPAFSSPQSSTSDAIIDLVSGVAGRGKRQTKGGCPGGFQDVQSRPTAYSVCDALGSRDR